MRAPSLAARTHHRRLGSARLSDVAVAGAHGHRLVSHEVGDGHIHVLAASFRKLEHLLYTLALRAELATSPATTRGCCGWYPNSPSKSGMEVGSAESRGKLGLCGGDCIRVSEQTSPVRFLRFCLGHQRKPRNRAQALSFGCDCGKHFRVLDWSIRRPPSRHWRPRVGVDDYASDGTVDTDIWLTHGVHAG